MGYQSFRQLVVSERGRDTYKTTIHPRSSEIVILAVHGGNIEPGTSEIATSVAGEDFTTYLFEGTQPGDNRRLHITSALFDEPQCLELVRDFKQVVSIHGCRGDKKVIYVGGLDIKLKLAFAESLMDARFKVEEPPRIYAGRHPNNICNRGRRGKGVQFEFTEAFRTTLFRGLAAKDRRYTTSAFHRLVDALRRVLLNQSLNSVKKSDSIR